MGSSGPFGRAAASAAAQPSASVCVDLEQGPLHGIYNILLQKAAGAAVPGHPDLSLCPPPQAGLHTHPTTAGTQGLGAGVLSQEGAVTSLVPGAAGTVNRTESD